MALLTAMYPMRADVARIVLLDHVVLHTGDFGGMSSLHPEIPGRVGELGMKRELVQDGMVLMGARGLVVREMTTSGIYFGASDDARPFLAAMDAEYVLRLRARCAWVVAAFGSLNDDAIRDRLGAVLGRWSEEYEPIEGHTNHG
nr:ABC-three component system middle component 2 [Demequina maris]